MSRKKRAPKKIQPLDPIYKSAIIPKLVNSIMYDGKKIVAEKIVYEAIDKIKSKVKDEPINVFNEAIKNIKPSVEVRSRRVGLIFLIASLKTFIGSSFTLDLILSIAS
jgi:small subunit ribosomal protein S7